VKHRRSQSFRRFFAASAVVWSASFPFAVAAAAQIDPSEPETQITEANPHIFDCPNDDATLPLGPIEIVPLGGVEARGAALLFSGQSGGDVEGAVIWTSSGRKGDAAKVSVQFMVEVDGQSLFADSPVSRIPIEVYGYLLDEKGTVAGHLADGILLDECRRLQMIEKTGLKFVGDVDVVPGPYSFRVLVRNRLTKKFFLARRDLDARFEDPLQMVLLPPLVAEPQDSWVMAGGRGLQLGSVRDEVPGIRSWPSARPVWRDDEALEMVLGCSELSEGREISARLYDRLGNPVLDPDVEVNQEVSSGHGLTFYSVSVAALDVPVGEYRFAVSLNDVESGQMVSQSLPILIHDGDADFVWNDPAAPRATTSPSAALAKGQPTPEDLKVETMRAAYIEILRMWSDGEVVDARRKLAELEAPLESNASDRSWRQLVTVERLTALTLARSRPDSAMAVALLHRDMHSWYLSRRETLLAQHSWRMAAMIARVAPSIDGWDRSVDFSECMLLDLASRLVRSGDRHSARQLLETAAKVAPGSAPALLGLGALSERSGFPDEAVDELKTLYKKHPEHVEGRLRLAVNRARVGEEKAAEELFRGLLEPSYPLWIRTVAYQELGGLLIDEGRIDEAERQLREGVARIPGNQRLQILLAHAIDRAQRPREAGTVVDRLDMQGSQQNTSPRYRYSAWPDLDADRVRFTLDEARTVGFEALREALP
jgi:tetratricopeptide (TPR) repeat protein